MDLYTRTAQDASRLVTRRYSTSFALASRLFRSQHRRHIYNIYGLVRLADEIADTYDGPDREPLLDALEAETYQAIERGFSTNLIVHAFAITALAAGIDKTLIQPFFHSMRLDTEPSGWRPDQYRRYIYGSAEVVGLMCLRVFCGGNQASYDQLAPGARALGSAFQQVNFLRDLADDYHRLQRYYFPFGDFEQFDDAAKQKIIADIRAEFAVAHTAIRQLPPGARAAVMAAYRYYLALLDKLDRTPAATVKWSRIRLSNPRKLMLLAGTAVSESARRPLR